MRYATPWGCYCIDSVQGQPQLAYCHSFFVPDTDRGKGYAYRLKADQNTTLKSLGYDFASCTTAGDNVRQYKVLRASGWFIMASFPNRLTGGETLYWGYRVPRDGEEVL